jgi:hypothetical protein
MALLLGGQILGGVLGNTKKARTGTQSGSSSNTSTSKRVLDPTQQLMQQILGQSVVNRLKDPSAGLDPIKRSAQSQVNSAFRRAPATINAKYGRGVGDSGKRGTALAQVESERLGSMADLESQFAQMVLGERARGESIAQTMLAMPSETTTTSSGESSGTYTQPGSAAAAGIMEGVAGAASGLQDLSTIWLLNKMLSGGL